MTTRKGQTVPSGYVQINDEIKEAHDRLTGGRKVTDSDHSFIHKGIAYKAFLAIGDLAQGASESFSFYCDDADVYVHFKNLFLKSFGASVKVELIRGTTASPLTIDSAGGTASELIGPNNLNDNSTNTSNIIIKKTPTYTDSEEGEVWIQTSVSADSDNKFGSSGTFQGTPNEEIIMKPETYYVIKVTNVHATADAAEVGISMFWYEEDEGVYS
jgi:hypothetical protein